MQYASGTPQPVNGQAGNLNNALDIKDVRLLRLARNAYAYPGSHGKVELKNERGEKACKKAFLMLDYFDLLTYERDEGLTATDCFGLTGSFRKTDIPATSAQLMTLARHIKYDTDAADDDPFEYQGGPKKPFLSLLFVTMRFEAVKWVLDDELRKDKDDAVEKLLHACDDELHRETEKALRKSDALFRVFKSVNTGDFCVVLRSGSLDDTYLVSRAITCLGKHPRHVLGSLRYGLHIYCGVEYGPESLRPSTGETKISLQMEISPQALDPVVQTLQKPLGYTVHYSPQNACLSMPVSMTTFCELYPLLRAAKLGEKEPTAAASADSPLPEGLAPKLAKWLKDGQVTRLDAHVHFTQKSPEDEIQLHRELPDREIDIISSHVEKIRGLYAQLRDPTFLPNHFRVPYRNLLRQLDDLRKTFLYLWFQAESRVNGNMYYMQISLAIYAILKHLVFLHDHSQKNTDTRDFEILEGLVGYIASFVNAANSFHKLTQSVNFDSIESPNYEMQTRVDSEKYLFAYTEFLRSVLAAFYSNGKSLEGPGPKRTFPLFYVDFNRQKTTATTIFDGLINWDSKGFRPDGHVRIVTFGLQSVEALAHSYDTLPALMHEVSHHMRFLPKRDRNMLLAQLILQKLSRQLLKHWLNVTTDGGVTISDLGRLKVVLESVFIKHMMNPEILPASLYEQSLEVFEQQLKKYILLLFGNDEKPDNICNLEAFLDCLRKLFEFGAPLNERDGDLCNCLHALNDFVNSARDDDGIAWEVTTWGTSKWYKYIGDMVTNACQQLRERLRTALNNDRQDIKRYDNVMKPNTSGSIANELYEKVFNATSAYAPGPALLELRKKTEESLGKDAPRLKAQALEDFWIKIERVYYLSENLRRVVRECLPLRAVNRQLQSLVHNARMALSNEIRAALADKNHLLHNRLLSEEGQAMLNAFGILQPDDRIFMEQLMNACAHFSTQQIHSLLTETVQTHREQTADIGLIALMRMDSFGYLHFLSKVVDFSIDTYQYNETPHTDPIFERIKLPLALLLNLEEPQRKKLEENNLMGLRSENMPQINCGDYLFDMTSLCKHTQLFIKASPACQLRWLEHELKKINSDQEEYTSLYAGIESGGFIQTFADELSALLEPAAFAIPKKVRSFNYMTQALQEFYRKWYKGQKAKQKPEDSYLPWQHLMAGLQRLHNMTVILRTIQSDGSLRVDRHHFDVLWKTIENVCEYGNGRMRGLKWYQPHRCGPWSDRILTYWMLKPEAEANTPEDRRKEIGHNEMLCTSISFVLYYYYRNRLFFSGVLPESINEDEMTAWLLSFTEERGAPTCP